MKRATGPNIIDHYYMIKGILCFSPIVIRLQNLKEYKIWSKMSYCMILYASWELNESLQKIVFRHDSNRLRMQAGGNHIPY